MIEPIADLIRQIREAAGDSPAKAADKVGISRQGYNKWEGGDTENMKLRHLVTFCDKYRVNLEELVRGRILYVEDEAHPATANKLPSVPVGKPPGTAISYSATPIAPNLIVAEPDPEERLIVEAFRKATPELKRIMLVNAREVLALFEKRSEQKN